MAKTVDLAAAYKELNNSQKAALLMIAMGQKWATEIMRQLKDEEVKKISFWISQMEYVPAELTEKVIREFYTRMNEKTALASAGGRDYLKGVLTGIMGDDKATELIDDLVHHEESEVFRILRRVDPKQLAAYLKQEQPQTIALMLSYVEPERAAAIISCLPAAQQTEVVLCVAKMEEADPEIVMTMEKALQETLGSVVSGRKMRKVGGIKVVADLLNNMGRTEEKRILESLTEKDFDLASEIKELMFTFDDMALLDDKSLQLVLKEVEGPDLVIALKGANDEVKGKVFRNISKRQVQSIQDELSFMGPMKASAVLAVQQKIINIVRKLDEEGKILIQGKGGGGDEVIS